MVSTAKKKSQRAFNTLASSYDQSIYGKYDTRLHRRVLDKLNLTAFGSVLDLGCGTGLLLSRIQKPDVVLAGIDLAPGMIAEARSKLKQADLKVGDVEALPWPENSFDAVLSTLSFHHYSNPVAVLSEAARVLKPGGSLIIGDVWLPTPLKQFVNRFVSPYSPEGDVCLYSRSELTRLLDNTGFALVSWEVDITLFSVLAAKLKP